MHLLHNKELLSIKCVVKSELEKMRCFVCNFTSKIHIPCKNEKRHSVAQTLETNVDTVSRFGFHSVTFRRQIICLLYKFLEHLYYYV